MIPFTAVWSRVVKGAQPIGIYHQYASGNYNNGVQYPDKVGEILTAPRPWSNGKPVPQLQGTNFCGDAPLWAGELVRLTAPLPVDSNGNALCCNRSTDLFCRLCTGQTAKSTHVAILSGGTGDFAGLNGAHTMVNSTGCQWLFDNGTLIYQLTMLNTGPLMAAGFHGSSVHCDWVKGATWDCHSSLGAMALSFSFGTGTPPTCNVL